MLQLLTQYLISNKQVFIPAIGSFSIKREPASYDFGEKIIAPPALEVVYQEDGGPDKAQLTFLAAHLQVDNEVAQNRLQAFGLQLREVLQQQPLEWKGLGTLALDGKKVRFQSRLAPLLEPVAAHKVIHEGARHTIRIGEREVSSSFQREPEEAASKKYDLEWLAWLLVVLAALFIIFTFYRQNFSVHATGMQTKVMSSPFR